MKYFTFKEMITTDTGLPNIPNWEQIHNLENLTDLVREIPLVFSRGDESNKYHP